MSSPACPSHSSVPLCVLLSQSVLTTVQVQQEETAEDQIQAVTGVYGLCCSHLVHTQKKKRKKASAYFASPLLCCCLPLSCLTPPHYFLLLSSTKVFYTFNFLFIPPTHPFCVSLFMLIFIFSISFCLPALPFLLISPLSRPSLLPLPSISNSLLSQHSSPHINPSLPSSVPHNSIPTGSYIFLHLDTACVT